MMEIQYAIASWRNVSVIKVVVESLNWRRFLAVPSANGWISMASGKACVRLTLRPGQVACNVG